MVRLLMSYVTGKLRVRTARKRVPETARHKEMNAGNISSGGTVPCHVLLELQVFACAVSSILPLRRDGESQRKIEREKLDDKSIRQGEGVEVGIVRSKKTAT